MASRPKSLIENINTSMHACQTLSRTNGVSRFAMICIQAVECWYSNVMLLYIRPTKQALYTVACRYLPHQHDINHSRNQTQMPKNENGIQSIHRAISISSKKPNARFQYFKKLIPHKVQRRSHFQSNSPGLHQTNASKQQTRYLLPNHLVVKY